MLIQDKIVIISGVGPIMGQPRIGIAGAQGASAIQATSQQATAAFGRRVRNLISNINYHGEWSRADDGALNHATIHNDIISG